MVPYSVQTLQIPSLTLRACKNLASFWKRVFCLVSDITGIFTTSSPGLAILNLGIDSFQSTCHKIVTHILLAARLLITKQWKSNLSPNISEVIELVKQHMYESLLTYRQGGWNYLTIIGICLDCEALIIQLGLLILK